MIIGVCGKSCSGKSTLTDELIKYYDQKAVKLEIDKIGHKVLTFSEVKKDLVNCFGKIVINNNIVDRSVLGNIVFASEKEMEKLTNITWKYMQIEINQFLSLNKDKIIILDWALLPKTDYLKKCDIKILFDVPYEVRKARALKRDNISEEKFKLREKASMNYNLEDFDYVINDSSYESIKRLVKLI